MLAVKYEKIYRQATIRINNLFHEYNFQRIFKTEHEASVAKVTFI